jgi:hypothetical protein
MKKFNLILATFVALLMSGCMANSKQMILENAQQLEVRSYQMKTYNQAKVPVSRAVISTLQDLSFIIDKADMETGIVTATKLAKGASMKITISIREKVKMQSTVRVNAQFVGYGSMPEAVEDSETYQNFFSVLDKAVFLEKQGL